MKKSMLLLVLALMATVVSAQFKVGGGLVLGTKAGYDESGTKLGVGISVRGDYAFNDQWSVAPDFTFFFPGSPEGIDVTFWQLNGNAHYHFYKLDDVGIYALGGLNYSSIKVDYNFDFGEYGDFSGSASDGEIGLNLGGGASYNNFFGEIKYDTAFEQIAISVGILFGT